MMSGSPLPAKEEMGAPDVDMCTLNCSRDGASRLLIFQSTANIPRTGRSLIHKEVILVCRKQQRSLGIPHSHDFAHSQVNDGPVVSSRGIFETLCNSE